jgi:hypothetical protein
MPKEIYPSSYICDCGYECDFSENTITEIKAASIKQKQGLIADDGIHEVVFDHGEMIAIFCPQEDGGKRKRKKSQQFTQADPE